MRFKMDYVLDFFEKNTIDYLEFLKLKKIKI